MTSNVPGFSGRKLVRAREARGISQTDLGQKLGVTRAAVSQYENNQRGPSREILFRMAAILAVPVHYFMRDSEPEILSPLFFRCMRSATKASRLQAKRRYEWLREVVGYFAEMVELPRVDIPDFDVPSDARKIGNENIENIAKRLRDIWGLGLGPISNVTWLLENKGAIVAHQDVGDRRLDAFSNWDGAFGNRPFVIQSEEKNSAARSRFDAAHELGHFLLHRRTRASDLEDKYLFKRIEEQANYFAASFLLPESSFTEEIRYSYRLDALAIAKSRWKVSIAAMVVRLRNLSLISEETEKRLFIGMARRGWRTREPLDDRIEMEQPYLLRTIVEELVKRNMISVEALEGEVGLYAKDIEDVLGMPGYFDKGIGPVIKFPVMG